MLRTVKKMSAKNNGNYYSQTNSGSADDGRTARRNAILNVLDEEYRYEMKLLKQVVRKAHARFSDFNTPHSIK